MSCLLFGAECLLACPASIANLNTCLTLPLAADAPNRFGVRCRLAAGHTHVCMCGCMRSMLSAGRTWAQAQQASITGCHLFPKCALHVLQTPAGVCGVWCMWLWHPCYAAGAGGSQTPCPCMGLSCPHTECCAGDTAAQHTEPDAGTRSALGVLWEVWCHPWCCYTSKQEVYCWVAARPSA